MTAQEIILKIYQDWLEIKEEIYGDESFHEQYTVAQKRAMFLSDGIIGIVTYDSDLDLYFGEMIIETMLHITNGTTYQYIEDETNYKKYIQSVNYIISMLDWGSSIRGAWFDAYRGTLKIDMPLNIPEIDNRNGYVLQMKREFLNWFLDFLFCKVN